MTRILFLPSIYGAHKISGQSLFDQKRDELFLGIKHHPEQKRNKMDRHPLLDEAAQHKAEDMAIRGYFSHTSPDGISANENIILTGYPIPDFYSKKGNNGESLSKGHKGILISRFIEGWYNSPKHRVHVFGHDIFYRNQECIGIGWSVDTEDIAYQVFISMPCP